jgi:hypothetical protein
MMKFRPDIGMMLHGVLIAIVAVAISSNTATHACLCVVPSPEVRTDIGMMLRRVLIAIVAVAISSDAATHACFRTAPSP